MGNLKLLVLMLVLAVGQSAWSQSNEATETTTKVEAEAAEKEEESSSEDTSRAGVEKLEVTGSHIRRTDVEGPSPVVIIDREKIEASGMNSVGSVLMQSTASSFGSDGASVDLKGLGSAKTLVLINGQRAPASGSSYGNTGEVSTNFVPLAAVERIEILKDGASATYGSDALGGVVNIITRKDISGWSFANQYNMTDYVGGDTNRLSVAYGSQTSKSNFMSGLQVTTVQSRRTSALDYASLATKGETRYATNYRNDASATTAGPDCKKIDANGACRDNDMSNYISEGIGADWVSQYTRQMGDTEFYSTLMLGYDRSVSESPLVLFTPNVGFGLGVASADVPAAWTSLPGYSGGDTVVNHRFDDVTRTTLDQNYYLGIVTGLKGYFGDSDWAWDATINNQFNTATETQENVGVFSSTRAAILADRYNPFDLSKRDTTGIGTETFNRNRYMINWSEFKANGEVGEFLGANWASAFGASVAYFEYADHTSAIFLNGDAMGQAGVNGRGGRELYSVFAEASGLFGDDFELQASLRGDFYSDFGNTVNPKLAARYQPLKWLTFRTSVGTGFQAPTLQQMNTALSGFFNGFLDIARCDQFGDCTGKSAAANQVVNPSLEEEKSISFNFGTIIQPTKSFTVGLDYWNVSVKDVIGNAVGQALRLEADEGPTAPQRYGVTINRDPSSGQITSINYSLANLGSREIQGLDFDMRYDLPTRLGKFTFANELTYTFHYYQSFITEFGREDIVGRQGLPRWRNNLSVAYEKGSFGAFVLARSTADMLETGNISGELSSIPSPTQFDVSVNYKTDDIGEFTLGVINLGNRRHRFDSAQGIDSTLFRPFETYYMTYRNDF